MHTQNLPHTNNINNKTWFFRGRHS